MKKIHVIPHTHWDKEWYFTASRSKIYFCKYFKDILETLEKNEDFTYYTLDGQSSLLEDYLTWVPEDKERIKKLVTGGKLIVGPWYTQSDLMIISGESIVRNLYYGTKTCEELGACMKIGYVPDSFGQAGNMPQIYDSFDIHDSLFWRGTTDEHVKFTDFEWEGDDGTCVYAKQIPYSYALGGKIPEGEEDAKTFWNHDCLGIAGERSATENIYFPHGSDQFPIRKNLPELIKKQNERDTLNEYCISNPAKYFSDIHSANVQLEKIKGELTLAKHCRIHKSIFSSRSDIKILNTKVQNYVANILEPLLTMSFKLGNEYPHHIVEKIWKLLFENAAHDSAGSCCSDATNEVVYTRYTEAYDLAINLVELHSRLIATKIKSKYQDGITVTMFNTLPYKRNEIAEIEMYVPDGNFAIYDGSGQPVNYRIISKIDISDYILAQTIRLNPSKEIYIPTKVYLAKLAIEVKDLAAFGYEQYAIKSLENSCLPMENVQQLENAYYQIKINNNGTLNIYDKQTDILYENQCVFMDGGDDGDSFNYSPPRNDFEIRSDEAAKNVNIEISGSSIYQCASITFHMNLPYDLENRLQHICEIDTQIHVKVVLKKDSKVIDFQVELNNNVLSHRLSVLFDAQISTKFNFADQQFGTIQRPNCYEKELTSYVKGLGVAYDGDISQLDLSTLDNQTSTWHEPPIAIEPTQSFVALAGDTTGIALLPTGVREYEILQNETDQIRLTLFRTYGYMGKCDLVNRPGRASGETIIETPDAQLLKNLSFKFGFTSFNAALNNTNLSNLAKVYTTEIMSYTYADFLNGRSIFTLEDVERCLENKVSLLETENTLSVSAIKKWEDGNGVIIRLYNGQYKQIIQDKLTVNFDFQEAYLVDSQEKIISTLPYTGNTVEIQDVKHCKFITVLLR